MVSLESLQVEVEKIKKRNKRVEADKAWETSKLRIGLITIITYIVVVLVMFSIDIARPFYSALIPTLGFFLSVQSLPIVKEWWTKKYF